MSSPNNCVDFEEFSKCFSTTSVRIVPKRKTKKDEIVEILEKKVKDLQKEIEDFQVVLRQKRGEQDGVESSQPSNDETAEEDSVRVEGKRLFNERSI